MKKYIHSLGILFFLFLEISKVQCQLPYVLDSYIYNNMTIVFEAKIDSTVYRDNLDNLVYFQVTRGYKGNTVNKKWIMSNNFRKPLAGTKYLVFVRIVRDSFFISNESYTHALEDEETDLWSKGIKILKKLAKKKYSFTLKLKGYNDSLLNILSKQVDTESFIHAYPNKQIEAIGAYKNVEPIGTWTYYYMNGYLKARGDYVSGRQEGYWEESRWNDILSVQSDYTIDKGLYKNGQKIGQWKVFNLRGEFVSEYNY